MFDYHPERGRVTDDSTGQTDSWQNRPVEHLGRVVSSSLVLSNRTQIKFWVTECLTVFLSTSSGSLFSIPPSADILYAVVPASANDREGVGWVKARQRSEASSPEHRERSDRPRSDVSLVVSGSFKHTEQPGSFAPAQPPTTVTCILRRKPGLGSLFSTPTALLSPIWGCVR